MTKRIDSLSRTAQDDLVRIFIAESKRKRKKLMDALLRCATAENQTPAETLRTAIDSISNTIAALKSGNRSLADLRRFHLSVSLPVSDTDTEAYVSIEINQRENSHPLPLQYYLEVKPPVGECVRTPVTKQRQKFTYTHMFDLGERNSRQIEMLRASDMEFRIYHRRVILGKAKNILVALATAPLSPLAFSLNATAPLNFMAMDGKKTSFFFEVRMSLSAPLVAAEDLYVDEHIDVIRD